MRDNRLELKYSWTPPDDIGLGFGSDFNRITPG
jgi:hypothetical protein